MILQALNRYYEILANDPESGISPPGYSSANVSFALNLSAEGVLLDIFPLFVTVQRGKKTIEVPRKMIVPEQVKRSSGISANFLCDNSAYVLGLSDRDDPQYALRRFEAFLQRNRELLVQVQCPEARALVAFLERWNPRDSKENPVVAAKLEELVKGGNLVFMLNGAQSYVHEVSEIRQIWEMKQAPTGNEYTGQCLVTGEIGPIARLHPSVKGVVDANPTGATLVGFNARAYESYNRTEGQGLNSPVSKKATFAYSTALNYMLSRENNRKFTVGDATVVYWAESKEPAYGDIFASLFEPNLAQVEATENAPGRDHAAEQRMSEIAQKVRRAEALDTERLLEGLNGDTFFYVLGLAPNSARISVRFFHSDPFYKLVQKIMSHYADLQIVKEFDNQPDLIPIWQLLNETVSKKSSDKKPAPLMAGAVLRAILGNTPYPAALYYAIINRIRADMDDTKQRISKINYVRAAIIKAYLTRKYRFQTQNPIEEVLCMALNEQSTHPAYLLGRLFAVLEKAQKDAIPNLDATIKDRYFTSACASPASVFPVLLRLSQHHIAKAEHGYASDNRIEKIMGLLDVDKQPFPAHLNLDEQGVFVLGYYHQRAAFYTPKNSPAVTEEHPSEK